MTPRHCDTCARRYWRRNALEVWRPLGDRWVKVIIRQCLDCQDAATARRLLQVANVAIGPRGGVAARRRP